MFPFTGLVADINIKFVVSFKCANVGNLELSCAIPATGWSSTGRRGVARGGLRGLEHPPLSSAIVGGAIQHSIILYMH